MDTFLTTIRLIEERSLNALPCLHTIHYDGWLLRFAGGYPRRANSIQLFYPSTLPLDEKIAYCEALYTARGCKTVFKMTPAAPDGLEAALRARGYVEDCCTSIQTLDLAGVDPQPETTDVLIEPRMSEAWFEACCRLNGFAEPRASSMRAIFERVPVETAFVRLCRDAETVALGLGALERGWIGLFDIVTDARVRRQGIGRQLVLQLLKWGKGCGAHSAYLQVMTDNAPALRLYETLGFREQYQYWYLQK